MAKLTGQTIADSYDQLLIVDAASGISASLQAIEAGDTGGSASSLKISTSKCEVIPASNSTSLFEVSQADGTAVLSVDTTNARVGIGTDSPDAPLSIKSSGTSSVLQSYIKSSDANHIIEFEEGGASQGIIEVKNASGGTAKIRLDGAGDTWFNGGNVGIGTSAPGTHLATGTVNANYLDLNGGSYMSVLSLIRDETTDNNALGTISFVNSNNNDAANNDADGMVVAEIMTRMETDDNNTHVDSGGHICFNTKPLSGSLAESMRIQDDGNVGIGDTSPTEKLTVSASTNLKLCKMVNTSSTTTDCDGLWMDFSGASPNDTTQWFYFSEDSTQSKFIVYSNGDVYTRSGTDIQAISDKRLKKDVEDYSGGLAVLNSLQPKTYYWKEGQGKAGKQYGFLAQEIKESDAVKEDMNLFSKVSLETNIDEEGNTIITDPASELCPDGKYATQLTAKEAILISAIQELSAKVTALENA